MVVELMLAAVVSLGGKWTLNGTDENGAAVECAVNVPGGVFGALLANGTIPDPYWRLNEDRVQWVSQREWTISRSFDVGDDVLAAKNALLRFEGVDTFASLYLNGTKLGDTDNCHRRWDFDVTKLLRRGRNELRGVFRDAEQEIAARAKKYDLVYNTQQRVRREVKQIPLIRKVQCHAGWDWGITLMEVGFSGDVKLVTTSDQRIDYVRNRQRFDDGYARCEVEVLADVFSVADGEADYAVELCGRTVRGKTSLKAGMNAFSAKIAVERPELWWPAGQGAQALHPLVVRIGGDVFRQRIGFRKIEVMHTPDVDPATGKPAAAFYYRVNGRPVYCRGCNWIPADAIRDRLVPSRYRSLLEGAAEANMNMVRVWGGGQFEPDFFYEMCDELGLLVWHDFMFGCAPYPGDEAFLGSVAKELEHQIKRLQAHPSIALWSGDNECYGAVVWCCCDGITRANVGRYLEETKLRGRRSAEIVKRLDPDRPWWPSSPGASEEGYTEDFAGQERGDVHIWPPWYADIPFTEYQRRRPRFVDEFGYQSAPCAATIATFAEPGDVNMSSPVMYAHQKSFNLKIQNGQRNLLSAMAREFRMPDSQADTLWLTQHLQALALQTAIRWWRALKPYCMGVCVWQLNDDWPAVSWSTVDYGGRWKQSMYALKRLFAPVAVMPYSPDGRDLRFHAVNDTPKPAALEGEIVTRTFGGAVVARRPFARTLGPNASVELVKADAAEFGTDAEREDRFLTVDYAVDGGERQRADWFFARKTVLEHQYPRLFARYGELPLEKAKVGCEIAEKGGAWTVTLETDRPAFLVSLDAAVAGRFSDSAFTLVPGERKTVVFTPAEKGASFEEFKSGFSVKHLRETYR